jgi:hypothetical protein
LAGANAADGLPVEDRLAIESGLHHRRARDPIELVEV